MEQWIEREPTHESPYWPFRKTQSVNTLAGVEQLPYTLVRYLMDMPDGTGYIPPDDNKYPRARLKKLLYWDTPLPLEQRLPTPEEMESIVFDPVDPAKPPDKERGYRIYAQEFAQQAQHVSQSTLHVYLGNTTIMNTGTAYQSGKGMLARQQIIIKALCNYSLEGNMGTTVASRSSAIMQAITEALAGVSFGGIGGMSLQTVNKVDDERVNLGFKLYFTLDWMSEAPNPFFEH